METEVSQEMEMVMAHQSRVLSRGSNSKNPTNPRIVHSGEEAVKVGRSGKSAMDQEVMGKDTLQQLFKDLPNKLDILDHGEDDENDEIGRGKSAIEEHVAMLDVGFTSEMEAEYMTIVESDKLLLTRADPSATNSIQYYHLAHEEMDRGKSDTPLAKKMVDEEEMADEAESFLSYRREWECAWSKTCGFFKDITVLSSMQFTHYTPGLIPHSRAGSIPKTLQILSLKLIEIAGGLDFPLSVYGVVAAHDIMDHNRNIVFYCNRNQAQELKPEDNFLHLMGPSRAIVFMEEVDFEIELEVKGTPDKALICCARKYKGGCGSGVSTICFNNIFCTLELCLQPVGPTVQATIVGVKVDGPYPLKYGGLVACYPLSGEFVSTGGRPRRNVNPPSSKIVLLDSKYGAMPKDSDGYIHLLRQVVSVEYAGGLNVVIQAYSKSGRIAAEGVVPFTPKKSQISQDKCDLGNAQVTITVAWSLVPTDKMNIQLGVGGRRVA